MVNPPHNWRGKREKVGLEKEHCEIEIEMKNFGMNGQGKQEINSVKETSFF